MKAIEPGPSPSSIACKLKSPYTPGPHFLTKMKQCYITGLMRGLIKVL